MSIRIDEEFKSLIPPLSADEYAQLEKNIVKDGIRDPLVVWPQDDGTEILIDGHNRWNIAAKHGGIPFKTVKMDFGVRDAVKLWIIRNQLGRRNLPKIDEVALRETEREIIARQAKERQGVRTDLNIKVKSPESGKQTRDIMGAKIGISGQTYDRLRTINAKASEETKQAVRDGTMSINKAYNSLRPKQQDPVKQAKQEHEEFQTKKSDGIVNLKDVQIDKINQDIIGNSLLQEVLKLINEVDKFAMIHKTEELKTLTTAVKDDERGIIADKCKTGRMTLQIIENYIRGI